MFKQRSISPEQALQKLRHYCGYQERCHQEVKEKLYGFGLRKSDVENAVATLIEEDRLNEERFAIQFAGGHFRLKNWGKIKIRYELRQKRVSEYCIDRALAAIDEDDYAQTLNGEAARKWETLEEVTDLFSRRKKLYDYLLQKGFESDKIRAAIATVEAAGSPRGTAGTPRGTA
jgi:regulatory protein